MTIKFKTIVSLMVLLPAITLAATVTNIQVSAAKITFNFNGAPAYYLFTLRKPDRLVIDIKNAKLATRPNKTLPTASVVKNIRTSENKDQRLRIVLDLKKPTKFHNSLSKEGPSKYKLVLSSNPYSAPIPVPPPTPTTYTTPVVAARPSFVPKLYLEGYTGSNVLGDVDVLAPVVLENNQAVFFYGQAHYSYADEKWLVDPWSASMGMGYRCLANNNAIFGFYLFGDYNQAGNGEKFWDVSPGIELLSNTWDARFNAYVPVSKHEWTQSGFASDFGDYSYVRLDDQHTRYDHIVNFNEEAGMGTDGEVGRKLFKVRNVLVKGYLQGYYFHMQHNNDLKGAGAKITVQPNGYLKFTVEDNYDNYVHNTVALGMQISINDLIADKKDLDLESRLLEPVERDLAATAQGATAIPVSGLPGEDGSKEEDEGEEMEQANVWYFTRNYAHGGAGTKANPYGYDDFNQAKVTYVFNNPANSDFAAEFDFQQSGTYSIATSVPVLLYPGQSVYGRDDNYINPATGSNRPILVGALTLPDNNAIYAIRLQDTPGSFPIGITVLPGASDILLNNVDVGSESSTTGAYPTGIAMYDAAVTIENDSHIYGYDEGDAAGIEATGIAMYDGGNLTVKNSTVKGTAKKTVGTPVDDTGNGYGIHGDGQANTIDIVASNITGKGDGGDGKERSGNGYGILLGEGTVTVGGALTPIANNSITIEQGSHIIGEGKAGTVYAGNGYGILIGYGYIDGSIFSPVTSATVTNNSVEIKQNSQVEGLGSDISIGTLVPDDSGNGYGLLVGYGFTGDDIDAAEVDQNAITINQSIITGESRADDLDKFSNNAYGVLVGFGHVDAGTVYFTRSITNNRVTVSNNSQVTGDVTGNAINSSGNSGNGYGLAVGFGALTLPAADGRLYLTDNKIQIASGSNMEGIGAANAGADDGFSYGVLVGYGYAASIDDALDFALSRNTVSITNAYLNSTSKRYGGAGSGSRSYGLLVGLADNSNVNPSIAKIADNQITVANSTIDSTLSPNANGGDEVYGVKFGVEFDLDDFAMVNNVIQVNNSNINIFNINGNGDSWGIYVDKDTGNFLNADAATSNNFSIDESPPVSGGKIHNPDGSVVDW